LGLGEANTALRQARSLLAGAAADFRAGGRLFRLIE
jgi:hypothetical protein